MCVEASRSVGSNVLFARLTRKKKSPSISPTINTPRHGLARYRCFNILLHLQARGRHSSLGRRAGALANSNFKLEIGRSVGRVDNYAHTHPLHIYLCVQIEIDIDLDIAIF